MNKVTNEKDVEMRAAMEAEAEKYSKMAVDGCTCSLCASYRERAKEVRAALAGMSAEGTTTEGSAAEETKEAQGNGFKINAAAVLNTFHVSEAEDIAQIRRQLDDAPLFCSLSARDMHRKRAPIMYHLTSGAEVLEAKAVLIADYLTRFKRQVEIALTDLYYKTTYPEWHKATRFWRNDSIIRLGVLENKIAPEVMREFDIRSPKFSKYLIKTYGEKSEIVKLFNDRPKAADIEKQTAEVEEGKKVIVSNLASNVMKMTAENAFNSCQNYTYEDACDLEYLQRLPSAVHDETLSIAYLVEEDEGYKYPYMLARVLISPLEYNGNLFFIGFNLYGDDEDAELLKSSLKNLYGERFLFADEMYETGTMYEWEYKYNYTLRVCFEYDSECFLCEGSGEVNAVVRYYDYDFVCVCPHCDGDGRNPEGGDFGAYPYVNNGAFIYYSYNKKTTRADKKILDAILTEEAYGGKDLFTLTAAEA